MNSDHFLRIFLKDKAYKDIPFKVPAGDKNGKVKYNLTLREIDLYLEDVRAITFRSAYKGLFFNPLEFYNQIILSIKQKQLSEVPICILSGLNKEGDNECKVDFEQNFKKIDLNPHDHRLIFEDVDYDEQIPDDLLETIQERANDFNKIKSKINSNIQIYIEYFDSPKLESSHDRSNRWAPLLILKYLNYLYKKGNQLDNEIDRLEDDISEDLYFKKKLYEFSNQEPEKETSLIETLQSKQHDFLQLIKGKKVTILIVEDELSAGWETVYKNLLLNDTCRLIFSESFSEALKKFNKDQKNIDLVILDIRLGGISDGEFDGSHVNGLSGVQLAKKFRKIDKTIPILAATASNKSWTLESLLNYEINNYWVKISPDGLVDQGDSFKSIVSLYEKMTKTMKWSLEIKPLINDFYSICDVFNDDSLVSQSAEKKSKSFHVLMHQTFDGSDKAILDGLQINIGYITFYSLINELISYFCFPIKINENETQYRVKGKEFDLFTINQSDSDNKYSYSKCLQELCRYKVRSESYLNDSIVFRGILNQMKPKLFKDFNDLKKIRNKSPLTHGKIFDDECSDATLDDLKKLSCFFKKLLDIHSDT
jgi:CheY-like chemotaxis protein